MMYPQFPRIRYVSQVSFVGGQFAISIHQIIHGFTPPPVQKQYVIKGMGGRISVAKEASCIGLALVQGCELARQLVEC